MEKFSVAHKSLQVFCADFWPAPEDCALILTDIGIDSTRIRMNEPSIMRWLSIISELIRRDDGSMSRLVTVLMKPYPENSALRDVCAPWIPATPAKPDDNAEADASVPKGDVLVNRFKAEPEPEPEPETKPQPKPKRTPPAPVIVTPEPAVDEVDLVVPKLDTLWAAMIDVENRLAAMELWRASPQKSKVK